MMKGLYYFLKNYLGFSRRESRGFLLVLPALLVLYLIPSVYDYWLTRNQKDEYNAYLQEVGLLLEEESKSAPERELLVKKTTSFVEKESGQLSKDTTDQPSSYSNYSNAPELNKINFAEADSIVLQIVPGIGETLSGRIVRFRESLGGLHSKEQLLEVYGLSEEVVDRLFTYFEFTPSISRKLAINELNEKELSRHPYINYGQAKVIVAYREQHGEYRTKEDLLKVKIFSEAWVNKLSPYLFLP